MRVSPFAAGPTRIATGRPTGVVAQRTPEAPVNVSPPTILGTARVGEILTAAVGTWTGYPAPQFTFQWNRDGSPIEGAQAATYELGAADYGAVITVTVTATNSEDSASETSEATAEVAGIAPANVQAPQVSGVPEVGRELSVTEGEWTGFPEPTITYQWMRDSEPIEDADAATYTLVSGDEGAMISCRVTATNDEGSAYVDAEEVGPVAAATVAPPSNISKPTISGTAKVGETLTASAGVWAGNPEPTYAYQWNRDGDPISGAENSTYTLIADDFDAVITVTVTATNSEGEAEETSDGTDPVAGIVPANTVAPSISGTAQVGETLTASAGTWTGVPTPSYSYQWKRDGNSIGGATNSTYQLVAADYGAVITVTVTATNSEGSSSETSAGTSAVAGLAPVNTAAPVISGTPKVGESLSVTTGTWTGVPTPSISYQWTRDESDISGATGSTYTLIEDDEDAMIGCRVTATNAEGSDNADAEEVGPVEAAEELPYNPQHFITQKGWAQTDGHLSGPGGTYDTLKVTTLAASGAGSLKAALEASGPRLIVFEVSGVIDLGGAKITVTNPYVTVAGQTAPSPGVAIIKGQIENATHDAIWSHLSFFAGTSASSGQDCFATTTGSYKVIIDHCAFFWGRDGNLDISGYGWNGANVEAWRESTSHEVTVSACVIAENFGSGGMLISDNTTKILTDRNYFYACRGRNGHYKGGTYGVSANNLIYNPQDKFFDNTLNLAAQSGDSTETHESYIDLIGNVCKAGPDTTAVSLFRLVSNEDVNLYLSDNEAKTTGGSDYPDTSVSTTLGEPLGAINIVGSPSNTGHGATFMPRGEVVAWIKANVGPRPWDRQAHTQRVLDHYDAGTGAHITNQDTVGGYPALAQNLKTFVPEQWDLATMAPASEDALTGGEPVVEPVTPEAKAVGRGTVYDTGTSITTSAGTTAESGSSFLLLASWEAGPAPTTVTDNKGNTYTLLGDVQASTGNHCAAQYLCANGVGGAGHTATINFDGAGIYGVAHLIEIVGCTSNPLDKHVQGTDGASPYTVATGTLAQADEVVVAFFAPQTANSNTIHQSSNTTIISAETNGANFWASAVGTAVVSSTSSFSPSFTANGLSGTAYMSVMTFKVAS